jgi:hypothetical protein
MPLVLPTSFYNAHYHFELDGGVHSNSFALAAQLNAGVDPDDLAHDLYDAFVVGYDIANMYSQWAIVGVTVEVNPGAGIVTGEWMDVSHGLGGGAETSPPNTSLIVKKLTGFASRAQRGRMYFPPFSLADDDVNDNGTIDATPLATIVTNFNAWQTQIFIESAETDSLFLLHEQASPGPGTPTLITSFVIEELVATQRRRLR